MDAKEFLKQLGINNRVINSDDLSEYWKTTSELMEEYLYKQVNNVVLDGVMNGFYDWHKEKGYITLKRDDFEEYLNSLKK